MFLYNLARKANAKVKQHKKAQAGKVLSPVRRIERVYPPEGGRFVAMTFDDGPCAHSFSGRKQGLTGSLLASLREVNATASFDVINKYFTISSMPVVSSTYWNHVYGAQPEEVAQDPEGLMTMYNIGKNMAWLLECIELGRKNGLEHPDNPKVLTNFTRRD